MSACSNDQQRGSNAGLEFAAERGSTPDSLVISRERSARGRRSRAETGAYLRPAPRLGPVLLWILLLALLPASAVADAGGAAPDCSEETALSRAAAELLLSGRPPAPEALQRAVREAGSDAVGVRAFFLPDAEANPARWLDRFRRQTDAPTVCGFARSDRGQLLLVAARAGSLEPLSGASASVRGSLAAGFRKPELVVEDAAGELQRLAVETQALARGVPISDELARPARVQLVAHGPAGPRPVAERIIPSRAQEYDRTGAASGADPQRQLPLVLRLDRLRQAAGRVALRENRLLARVAAAHARHVCEAGRVAHELDPGVDPQRRLNAAGVQARRVGETVARAGSAAAAFAAFEHSPSHRLTLVEPGFTDAGIGEATDEDGATCVVVLLAAWPRYVGR
jgi:uncharacterized protein YkwD